MIDALLDAIIDSLKLLPFLFITYLLMELLENKAGEKSLHAIKKSGKFGPILGAILGIIPQCGFSAAAANLYAGRIITLGSLVAIFLSTSDEMLPILISEAAPINLIIKILLIKLIIGMLVGVIIDFIIRKKSTEKDEEKIHIHNICEDEHCHCEEDGILKSSIKHTLHITLFIFIITLIINTIFTLLGEKYLSKILLTNNILSPLITSLIGLIPNCAASVILTELYLNKAISLGALIGGLLTSSGSSLLILLKNNKNKKENITIILLLYSLGAISGIIIELINIMK